MWEKWFVYLSGRRPIALKHNGTKLHVGGYISGRGDMEKTMQVYFKRDPFGKKVKVHLPGRNKIQMIVSLDRQEYVNGITEMKEGGCDIRRVQSHERVMR